jgi:hypothetical protein
MSVSFNKQTGKFEQVDNTGTKTSYTPMGGKFVPQGGPMGEFEELSVSEIEMLGPTERQEYLRRKAARGASGTEAALKQGAEAQAAAAKQIPAQMRQQLASSMMGLAGGGLAQGLGAMGQMAKTVTPAVTMATIKGEKAAADAAADAVASGVDAATYLADQGVGSKAALKADVKQRIEKAKGDLRNWFSGIDADKLEREMQSLKQFYMDDNGNIDPEISRYIDEQTVIEKKAASGWDIF